MAESNIVPLPANPTPAAPRDTGAPVHKGDSVKKVLFDKSMATTANLAKLLPSGTTLAFQTLSPSFTNHGKCFAVNRVFSWGLIGFLGSVCALLCFTDSFTDADGSVYYGLALLTEKGFHAFNYDYEGQDNNKKQAFSDECKKLRVKPRDFLHSFFSALVFLSLAFDDAEIQICLLQSRLTEPWKEFLVNLPLATGFLASFVFMIFPSTRKGIGYDAAAAADSPSTSQLDKNKLDQDAAAHVPSAVQPYELAILAPRSLEITDVARVAPSASHYERDSVV